eukprot:TRINITY_DN9658_c0_g1_i6.p1 TRINITY_DN9658_c0_g1~~TRINITY_DN9658_c0_g1_i6.p1  ORF type:complete len:1093 (-),score=145.55 TRINITY_DN9658_c0_g1_i6:135-3413(-)
MAAQPLTRVEHHEEKDALLKSLGAGIGIFLAGQLFFLARRKCAQYKESLLNLTSRWAASVRSTRKTVRLPVFRRGTTPANTVNWETSPSAGHAVLPKQNSPTALMSATVSLTFESVRAKAELLKSDRNPFTERLVFELLHNGNNTAEKLAKEIGCKASDIVAHTLERPGFFRVATEVDVDKNVVAHNYLYFLRLCRNVFLTLTISSILIFSGLEMDFTPWSFGVYGDVSMKFKPEDGSLLRFYIASWWYGLVVVLLAEQFRCQARETRTQNDDLLRTLWLTQLPVRDGLTRQVFTLHDYDVERVRSCLEDALNSRVIALTSRSRDEKVGREATERYNAVTDLADRLKRKVLTHDIKGMNKLVEKLRDVCRTERTETVVERMHVGLVVDSWYQSWTALCQAQDYKIGIANQIKLLEHRPEGPPKLFSMAGFRLWQYQRRHARMEARIAVMQRRFCDLQLKAKRLSGSIFVTLKEKSQADAIMQDNVPKCWHGRSHAFFNFGKHPFASVTLRCQMAPHPDDILWENLHITSTNRVCRFCVLSLLLVILMFFVVTPATLTWFLGPVSDLCPEWVGHQLPPLTLMLINASVLPVLIDIMTKLSRTHQKSREETYRSLLNFAFLALNIVWTPLLGLKSIPELISTMETRGLSPREFMSMMYTELMKPERYNLGIFFLRYLINATFLSTTITELDSAQWLSRVVGRWFAITERERQLLQEAWPFAWGYWYAYALSLFLLGLIASVMVPLALPVSTLLFVLKERVDQSQLVTHIYGLGSADECAFVPQVLLLVRLTVVVFWTFNGWFLYWTMRESNDGPTDEKDNWARAAIFLIVAAFILFVHSFAAYTQMVYQLQFNLTSVPLARRLGNSVKNICLSTWRACRCCSCRRSAFKLTSGDSFFEDLAERVRHGSLSEYLLDPRIDGDDCEEGTLHLFPSSQKLALPVQGEVSNPPRPLVWDCLPSDMLVAPCESTRASKLTDGDRVSSLDATGLGHARKTDQSKSRRLELTRAQSVPSKAKISYPVYEGIRPSTVKEEESTPFELPGHETGNKKECVRFELPSDEDGRDSEESAGSDDSQDRHATDSAKMQHVRSRTSVW